MKTSERINLAEWVIETAKKYGSSETSVSISNQREVGIEIRDRKLEKLEESTQNGLSLKIFTEQKYSSHSTNDMRKDSLEAFIKEAVASTKYLTPDKFRALPDKKYYPKSLDKNLDLIDPVYEKIDSKQRVEIASAIEAVALEQSDQIISVTAGYSDTRYHNIKMNSNGFVGETESTLFDCGAEVTVKDANGGRPSDWAWAVSRYYQDLTKPEGLGKDAVRRALRKVGQDKIESGQYDMIVENRTSGRLLGLLLGPMSAQSIQQKNSYLEDMLDKPVASPLLTVIDDPFIQRGLGSKLFDGEGLKAEKRVLIEKGVLKEYLVDNYYGNKLGWEPNSGSTSNVLFDYGDQSGDDMIKKVNKGILVTGFIGGNSNSTTGDFSFGIVGLLVENGKIVKPVNEMNISGNSKDFWQKLEQVGNDPYPYSSYKMPSMLFSGVQFSGL